MRHYLLLSLLCLSLPVFATGVKKPMYMQFLLGELQLNDDAVSINRDGVDYVGQLDNIPYLGGAAQVILNDNKLGYGWEGGGFISWVNDNVNYYGYSGGQGTTILVSVDNSFRSFETFMGLYVDLKPVNRLRLYVSGGPLVLYARAETKNGQEEVIATSNVIVTNDNNTDSDIALGWYARGGIEFRLTPNTWVGVNIRHMEAEVNLDKSIGQFDINGDLYLLTITNRY